MSVFFVYWYSLVIYFLFVCLRWNLNPGGWTGVAKGLGWKFLVRVRLSFHGGSKPNRAGLLTAAVREVLHHHLHYEHIVDKPHQQLYGKLHTLSEVIGLAWQKEHGRGVERGVFVAREGLSINIEIGGVNLRWTRACKVTACLGGAYAQRGC